MTAKELRQKRAAIVAAMQALLDGDSNFTAEVRSKWEKLDKEQDALKVQIEALERSEGLSREMNSFTAPPAGPLNFGTVDGAPRKRSNISARFVGRDSQGKLVRGLGPEESFAAFVRESGEVRDDSIAAREGVGIGDFVRSMILGPRSEAEKRALGEASTGAGGATVPTFLAAEVIDALRGQAQVMNAGATTVPLNTLTNSIARLTADPGAAWHVENTADLEVSDPTFDNVTFTARTLATIVRLSREVLQDSVNINSAVSNSLARSFASELDRVALVGSGVASQPKGLVGISSVGSVSMGDDGDALTDYDPFITAWQTILDAKANAPTAYLMAPRTTAALAKLKDAYLRYLAPPELVRNIPFLTTQAIGVTDTQGTSRIASKVFAGYWPELWVGVRSTLQIELLREVFAQNFQYGILCSLRADIQVAHPGSFCKIVGIVPTPSS